MWLPREGPFCVVLSPGHSRSLGTGLLAPCDNPSPAWAPKEVFQLLQPPGNLCTVLLVTQWVPAKTLSLPLSLAAQMFYFSTILGGTVAGSIESEA